MDEQERVLRGTELGIQRTLDRKTTGSSCTVLALAWKRKLEEFEQNIRRYTGSPTIIITAELFSRAQTGLERLKEATG